VRFSQHCDSRVNTCGITLINKPRDYDAGAARKSKYAKYQCCPMCSRFNKVGRLEYTLAAHDGKIARYDEAIAAILTAIRELMTPATPTKKRKIGFVCRLG
jgi:hypothetical protein